MKYAEEVGTAVSKALKQDEDLAAAAAAAAGTGAEMLKVTRFVQSALTNQSARAPLQGAAMTVAQAIDSPSPDLRRMVSPSQPDCHRLWMQPSQHAHVMRPSAAASCMRVCSGCHHIHSASYKPLMPIPW